jgi:hypothetical protein
MNTEAPMAERAFSCGNSTYYVAESYGRFKVQRQGWLGRIFLGYVVDLAEAIALIEADAKCWQIRPAEPAA